MDITENKDHIVEKKVYEDGKKEYASKGIAGTALGLGIAGTALGLGAWLSGGSRSVFGSLGGGNMPENVNINAYGNGAGGANSPTALQVLEKENSDEVELLKDMFGLYNNVNTKLYNFRDKDIEEKFSLYKGLNDQVNAETQRSMRAEFENYKYSRDSHDSLKDALVEQGFGLYKSQRDGFDALNEKYAAKFCELDKKVTVMEALAPYKEKLMMAYVNEKTCNCLRGQLVLPSTPSVTGLGSYNPCNCGTVTTTPTTGA
jgi:hypothetical protein